MAKKEKLLEKILGDFEKGYEEARAKEAEELYNAIVEVLNEHHTSIPNTLYVLDIIRFQYWEAKHKEIMGFVKLTEKPPVAKAKGKE